jgi:serine O-acetyltransferase
MKSKFKTFVLILNFIRCFPHLLLYKFHRNRALIHADTKRWLHILSKHYNIASGKVYRNQTVGFIFLLAFFPEFRNLFYKRVGSYSYILNIICPKLSSLYLRCKHIGEGLFIQHGFATMLGAKSIGKNCIINQQVTIAGNAVIMDNVKISSGAVIIGEITIGNNVVIGANTTVFKSIPDNCTVFPAPFLMMKWSGRSGENDTIDGEPMND